MDEKGLERDEVLRILMDARRRDERYGGGRILGSMCTEPHWFAREVFSMFMDVNLGDAGLFPGTKALEREVVSALASLLGFKYASGFVVTGGSEANITALWAARNATGKRKVLLPETAHFSFDKACDILGLEKEVVGVDEEKRIRLEEVERRVDEETCAIIAVAGSTEYGSVDDLHGLARIARERETWLHVDAAFGGFVLPFLSELGYTSFSLPEEGVSTITIDPHKMGLAPIPCACLLFKDAEALRSVETPTPYLTEKTQHTLSGTRCGAAAAAAYAVLKLLGREGYREVVRVCMENTLALYQGVLELGFKARRPVLNILVFELPKELYRALTLKGWRLSRTRMGETRIVVMPHVTAKVVEDFLSDLAALQGEGG